MAQSLYTLEQLQDASYSRLENNTLFFPVADITAIINEAIKVVNIQTAFYQGTATAIISVRNQLIYPTPPGILYAQRVQFEGTQLDPVPITRIGQDYRTWATDTSAKLGAVARWIPIGINYFAIHPADSYGGNSIFVTGVMEPPLLILPGDSMTLDDEYADIIVEYVASRVPLAVSGPSTSAALSLYTKSFIPAMKGLTVLEQMKWPRFFVMQTPAEEGRTK